MDRLKRSLASVGVVAFAIACAMVVIAPQPSRFRTLPSLWVAFTLNGALLAVLAQALIVGSAAEPKVVRWLSAADDERLVAVGARFSIVSLASAAVLFAMKRVIRVKLDYDSIIVLGCAFAAIVVSFELFGYWLTTLTRKRARAFRWGALTWLLLAVGHAVVAGSPAVAAQWFPFGSWTASLYESLIKGLGPDLVGLGASVACGAISAAAYVRYGGDDADAAPG